MWKDIIKGVKKGLEDICKKEDEEADHLFSKHRPGSLLLVQNRPPELYRELNGMIGLGIKFHRDMAKESERLILESLRERIDIKLKEF